MNLAEEIMQEEINVAECETDDIERNVKVEFEFVEVAPTSQTYTVASNDLEKPGTSEAMRRKGFSLKRSDVCSSNLLNKDVAQNTVINCSASDAFHIKSEPSKDPFSADWSSDIKREDETLLTNELIIKEEHDEQNGTGFLSPHGILTGPKRSRRKSKCKETAVEVDEAEVLTEIGRQATEATNNPLPEKSRLQYERVYSLFRKWWNDNRMKSFSENVLLAYFQKLSQNMKPSSLWSNYSMLRSTLNLKHNIDISKYPKLCSFLKRRSDGYKPKKSKSLTSEQIQTFLTTAPDEKYLFTKVGLIFGVMGACRREELLKIETSHVEDVDTALVVNIPDASAKTTRQFVIGGNSYRTCKKYMALRPSNVPSDVNRFFLNYQQGKCTKQPIGINKFGNLPREIAKFLKLPNPTGYTGHCLRRSWATILVDSDGDVAGLGRRGGWR